MYKAYLLDDESKAIDNLEFLIQQTIPAISEIKTQTDPKLAIQEIREFKPDLLFLDIQMPHMDGFSVLKALGNIDFEVIFTTAYDQYAIKAFKFSALDYLLKPVNPDDILIAFNNFTERKNNTSYQQRIINLQNNLDAVSPNAFKLTVQTSEGSFFLKLDEIIRIEADGNYSHLYLMGNRKMMNSKTLKEYEDILEEYGFVRVHKSHLVNKQFVEAILNTDRIVLKEGMEVPIARRRKKELKELLS